MTDPNPKPWTPLVQQLIPVLTDSLHDLIDTGKQEVKDFIANQAEEYAKQTWASMNASSDSDKQEAKDNLRHLKSQVIIVAMDAKIVATAKVLGLLTKVFETLGNFLIQYGPTLLAAIPK